MSHLTTSATAIVESRPQHPLIQRRPSAWTRSLFLAWLVCFAACATNPATGRRQISLMSEDQEIAIGQQQDLDIRNEMGVYSDRELQRYVSDVGMKLATVSERPNLPWHFTVVDTPAINAFALPGGFIYITRGIMPFLQDESQLAGVLGHEVGHVTARHAAEQYSRSTGAQLGLILGSIFVPGGSTAAGLGGSGLGILFLKYSRDDEAQADALGVRYEARAGWDPDGVPQMLTTLGRIEATADDKGVPNWMLTHPAPEDRVQRVQNAVGAAEAGATQFITERDAYMRQIDGLVFGDNPDQGIVHGRSFLHAGLRFAVDFPEGWTIDNGQTAVVARDRSTNLTILLQEVQRPSARSLQDVAFVSMQRAGFRAVSGGETTINGLNAFVATYQGALANVGRVVLRAAHIRQERAVYLLAGFASADAFGRGDPIFEQTIRSFRALTPGEAESIRPDLVNLYTAREGDTWESIAERSGRTALKSSTLAIMNGHRVDDQPHRGERLKIVVPG